jgi:hypothetical protein
MLGLARTNMPRLGPLFMLEILPEALFWPEVDEILYKLGIPAINTQQRDNRAKFAILGRRGRQKLLFWGSILSIKNSHKRPLGGMAAGWSGWRCRRWRRKKILSHGFCYVRVN